MQHLETLRFVEAIARAGSIRKAAEDSNITASALNRRLARFEREFGAPIFERLPRGVRLNAAGELVLQHYRAQRSDLARVQSQVADLTGVRRGHVSIACSQALLPFFLPQQIARYRKQYPGVTFSVSVRDREQAEAELASFSSDLALVFEPVVLADFQVLQAIPQPVCAVFASDHPLAEKGELRLRDCLDYPHVGPARKYGVRNLLDAAAKSIGRTVEPLVETESFELIRYYVLREQTVGFQIPVGLQGAEHTGLAFKPISTRDMKPGGLLLGQLRGRVLSVASLRFANQVQQALLDALDG
ncbi:MAG: LysR family transcriptional regulator [Pseudomonadota bacterium]